MTNYFKRMLALLCLLTLAACGGGGGNAGADPFPPPSDGGGGGGTETSAKLTAKISSPDVTATASPTVTVTVTDSSGAPIADQVVTLATTVGVLDVTSVLTGADGTATAQVLVNPTGAAGADEVTATAVVGSETLTAKVGYRVTTTPTAPSVIEVVASANSAGTDGTPITITAVVKGPGNVTIPGAEVRFSTDTGTLAAAASTTDGNGAATAQFSAGADKSNRTATITVAAGSVSGVIAISVEGTTLTYLGATTLTLGTPAQSVTITARDSKGSGIANAVINVTSALGNVSPDIRLTTDSSGVATLSYKPEVAGADTLTISGLGQTLRQPVTVIGQDFAFTTPKAGANIKIDSSQTIGVRYRVNGAVPAGAFTVRFTSTAGSVLPASAASTGVALNDGVATAQVRSTFAGPATLQATLYADSAPTVVVAQATLAVEFTATTPAALTLQVSPSALGPNAPGSTSQQVDVQAAVVDAFSNPVANVTVNFSRVADPSGGNLSNPSAVTNNNGIATVKFISGAQSTPSNGVVLKAAVASNAAVSGQATLTVNQSALFIALGAGNDIANGDAANTTYEKIWTAYVTDASGAAVPNVTLTVSALPKQYAKGRFAWNGNVWASDLVKPGTAPLDDEGDIAPGSSINCQSEDAVLGANAPQTNNGVLDPGEDRNGDGKLQPGNVISVNSGPSITTVRTDASGFAVITLRYAESYAYWVEVALKATATVAGTESSNEAVFWAPGMTSDYSNENVAPAGAVSPFGVKPSCTVAN